MQFTVRALDANGQIQSVLIDATDAADAKNQALARRVSPLSAEPVRDGRRRTERFDLLLFSHELHALLNAGLSVIESLDALIEKDTQPARRAVLKLVNSTLYDALRAGASDVHLESTPTGLAVKYRIDGTLDAITEVSGVALAEQAISRLKVLAELDIAERRVPQDGSFRVGLQGREVDLRVSIIPGIHGEDAVIRILDKRAGYKGRRAVAEVLCLDDELREMIVAREPIRRVKELAYRKGTRTLTDAALQLALEGETTLEEVRRVTLAA